MSKQKKFRVGARITVIALMLQLILMGGTLFSSQVYAEDTVPLDSSIVLLDEPSAENVQAESFSEPLLMPELTTDKADYHPGETATIFGNFFQSLQNIVLKIFGYDENGEGYTEETKNLITDETGSFTTYYVLDNVFRPFYTVVASILNSDGSSGPQIAQTTFTDNKNVLVSFSGTGSGTVNSTQPNSDIACISTAGVSSGTCTGAFANTAQVTLSASPGASSVIGGWAVPTGYVINDGCDSSDTTCQFTMNNTNQTVVVTFNSTATTTLTINKVCVPSGDTGKFNLKIDGTTVGTGEDALCGGTTGAVSVTAAIHTVSETAGTGTSLSDYTSVIGGDCATDGTVTLTTGQAKVCTITNTKLAHIIVVKNAVPDDAQDFSFTNDFGNGNPSPFLLDDDAQITLSDTRDSIVLPGTYAVSETVPSGWKQFSAICDQGETIDSIDVAAGETVTCTFVNHKLAKITVVKNTFGGDETFDFTAVSEDADLPANFSITTSGATGSQIFDNIDPDLVYSISEEAEIGWEATSAICTGTNSPASISPNNGEEITCTFTNTKQGRIIVDKVTDPTGDLTEFDFTTNYSDPFSLADDSTPEDSGYLDSGSGYSVSETVPDGWDQTSATCSDDSPIDNIDLAPGEIVTCTFTNQKDAKIIVQKQTDPDGDLQSFDFTASYDGDGFVLSDGQSNNSGDLDPGIYLVAETGETGWDLTLATCDNEDVPSAITIAAGETINCTFTNTKRGHITIEKQTLPDASTADFTFTGDVAGTLSDGETAMQEVVPGTYTSTEGTLAGWDLTSIICSDVNSTGVTETGVATFNVEAGEDVTCVFTNKQRGHIIVNKVTDPTGDLQSFAFTTTGAGYSGFSLTDLDIPNDQEVVPGAYSVSETALAGWGSDGGVCDNGETPASLDVEPGETVTCTFTNTKLHSISGVKFYDSNKDSLKAGEMTLAGWTMYLDTNNDGILNGLEASDVTDATGMYTFENLGPGSYNVREVMPAGWTQSFPGTANSYKHVVIISTSGTDVIDKDFGNYLNTLPPISITNKEFKKNSTIPVKFASPSDTFSPLLYVCTSTTSPCETPAVASGGSNTLNQFRYSLTGQQYIYNLSTKMNVFVAGSTYGLWVDIDGAGGMESFLFATINIK